MTEATTGSAFEHRGTAAGPDWTTLNLVGESPAFREMLALLPQWVTVDATVLLCGETGTGKELAARAVHYRRLPLRHR